MLLIDGVTAIVAGAALTALARLVSADGVTPPAVLRRVVRSRAFDALAVLLMCGGGLTLLIFLADYDKEPALLLQVAVAAVLGVGGTLGVRALFRRAGPPPPAEESSADPPERAA